MLTEQDLHKFIVHHDSLFAGFRKWWTDGDRDTLKIRTGAWLKRLQDVDIRQLLSASSALFESREKPPYYGQQLDWICNRLRPRPLLNETPAPHLRQCEMCKGTGMLTAEFYQQQLTPGGNVLPDNRGTVACKCSKGSWVNDRRRESKDGTQLQVFDAGRMRVYRREPPADMAERLARLEKSRPGLAEAMHRCAMTLRGDQ